MIKLNAVNAMLIAELFTMSACATIVTDGQDYRAGWRSGKIQEITSAEHIASSSLYLCRKQLSAEALSHGQFAVVELFRNQKAIASLPEDNSFKIGESVSININDCTQPLKPRKADEVH